MGVKLKTDENLPDSAAALLRTAGHDVTTALGEDLGGVADPRIAAVCRGKQRALVRRIVPLLVTTSLAGALWIVDERRVRIRR